jgi:hypothetical protein
MNAQKPDRVVKTTVVDGHTIYHVPSETHPGVEYDVLLDEDGQWLCTPCPDWAAWRKPCKHVFEVLDRFFPALAPPHPKSKEDILPGWYRGARRMPQVPFEYKDGLAESTRRDHALEDQDPRVESLLVDLAIRLNREFPELPLAHRHELPAGDKVLISVLRAQHRKSMRKFRPILKRLATEGTIRFAPCKTTIVAYNKQVEMTVLLRAAFNIVTSVFRLLDRDIIIDSTGFSPFYVSNWCDRRADENEGRVPTDYRSNTEWFKVHVIVGRISKAILAWRMTPYRGEGVGDTSLLEPLLLDLLGRDFDPRYLLGDNAYLDKERYEIALAHGVQLVAPMKGKNWTPEGLPRGVAQRLHAFALRHPELYDQLCRARQAIEGVFSTEKRQDNHVAAIGSADEREAHAAVLQLAAEVANDKTKTEEQREREVKALEDEAAAMAMYTARQNEMLVRAIRQVLQQTVQMELRWNRHISYTKGSVFGPVRETVEPE